MRYPAVAGRFYPGKERELREEIRKCYLSPLGPGEIPQVARPGQRRIVGAVVPHAGYMFSGPIAAHAYASIARDGFPETFIIIGPNHHAVGSPIALSSEDFETPLGVCRLDRDLLRRLERNIVVDPVAHQYEHSIEVQLPFMQFFADDVKILPICMALQDYETAFEIARYLREATKEKDVVIIASTDFSHYVPVHIAKTKDMAVINQILALNAKGVYEEVIKRNVSMCGYGPVMVMIEAVGGSNAELLKYGTSGDVHPMMEVVGYAAVTVTK